MYVCIYIYMCVCANTYKCTCVWNAEEMRRQELEAQKKHLIVFDVGGLLTDVVGCAHFSGRRAVLQMCMCVSLWMYV